MAEFEKSKSIDRGVLLVNSPILLRPGGGVRFPGWPGGVVTVATDLEQRGIPTSVLDLCVGDRHPLDRLLSTVEEQKPLVVAFGSYSPTHISTLTLALSVKMMSHDIVVVKGGIHETFVPDITLQRHPQVDFTIQGDGGPTLAELVKYLTGKRKDYKTIPGLSYRDDDRDVKRNPFVVLPGGEDSWTMPDRTLLEHNTFYDFDVFDGKKTAQMLTTRNCPYPCNFCPASSYASQLRGGFRWMIPDRITKELDTVTEQSYQAVFFDDSTFTFNRRRTEVMCELLKERNLEWGCQTRVDLVTPELLAAMKDSGCSYIFYGVEAGNDELLKKMRKGISAAQSWETIQNTIDAGIRVGVSVMLGYPEQTDEHARYTFEQLARFKNDLFTVSLAVLALYPGTELWDQALKEGTLQMDSYEYPHSYDPTSKEYMTGF